MAALGFGGTALIPTATTAAAAGKVATVAVVAKWTGIGIGTALLALGAVYEAPRFMDRAHRVGALAPRAPAVSPITTAVQAPASSPTPSPASASAEKTQTPDVSPVDVPLAISPTSAPRLPRATPTAQDTAADSTTPSRAEVAEPLGLSHQVVMLDTARQMVSTDPVGTLRVLDDYQSQFPHGDLAPEALVLRIEALVRSGHLPMADKLAREYLARNPGSPHARKIRALLSGSGAATQ